MYNERYMNMKDEDIKKYSNGNRIIEILIKRDGMTPNEAWNYFNQVTEEIDLECDDIEILLREEFGLEPDYLEDLIGELI